MLVAIVGGKLQGVEAAYLARKAGWDVILIDKKPVGPASGLCDRFLQLDVTHEKDLGSKLKGVDLVIPALEAEAVLTHLARWTQREGIAFAFDLNAYRLSSSKIKSDLFFAQAGVPAPGSWPDCRFPVLVKPDGGSGSQGVKLFYEPRGLQQHLDQSAGKWVAQEFVAGPSYSIEVIGLPGKYTPLQVTDLEMDKTYDCKRVLAPTTLSPQLVSDFKHISVTLAERLKLKGLMDVEVVIDDTLKVLEIDARLPSQTPMAVYWSSGVNMVQALGTLFLEGAPAAKSQDRLPRGVVLEHIRVTPSLLEVGGEHIMSVTDPLRIKTNFWGADEAITNYAPGRKTWVATLIVCERDRKTAWDKRQKVIAAIRKHFRLEAYRDPAPEEGDQGNRL